MPTTAGITAAARRFWQRELRQAVFKNLRQITLNITRNPCHFENYLAQRFEDYLACPERSPIGLRKICPSNDT